MVKVEEIRGYMGKRRISQNRLAKAIGICSPTLAKRFKRKVFDTSEIVKIVEFLEIPADEVDSIFFN